MFVRVTCHPYVFYTRKAAKLTRESIHSKVSDKQIERLALQFRQKFYIPVHNYYNTLTLEIVNVQSKGWIRDY